MTMWKEQMDLLCQAAEHPAQTIGQAARSTGRGAVGCFPPYAPREAVDACGLLPVGMWGSAQIPQRSERYVQSFCCSIMKADLDLGMSGACDELRAVLIPGFCDTLKCMGENWKAAVPAVPAIPLIYPQNRQASGARRYLVAELGRVMAQLAKVGGHIPSEEELTASLNKFEWARAAQREFCRLASERPQAVSARQRHLVLKAGWFMDQADYAGQLEQVNDGLAALPEQAGDKLRLVVTGIMLEPLSLLDAMDECGVCIAADDLAQESRQFALAAPEGGTALERMAARYLGRTGDPLVYDSKKTRGQHLIDMVRQSRADGVLIAMMKFCDPEEFDYPIYKKELTQAGIPMIYMETELSNRGAEAFRTRLDGFREMAMERREQE